MYHLTEGMTWKRLDWAKNSKSVLTYELVVGQKLEFRFCALNVAKIMNFRLACIPKIQFLTHESISWKIVDIC